MPERPDRTYRLEPLDGTGVFLGLGVLQCALLGGGIVLAVVALSVGAPLALAAGPLFAAAVAAFGRAGGHPLWAWIPLTARWAQVRVGHRRSWTARLPLFVAEDGPSAPMPPCLEGLEILGIAWRGRRALGAIHDRTRDTLTAVIPVSGPQFIVEPRSDQERLLAGWGDVLAQFAVERGAVTHLSWSDLARPSGMQQHRHWLGEHGNHSIQDGPEASYEELLGLATATAISHEAVVSITVDRARLSRQSNAGPDRLERALTTAVDALLRGLHSAGLTADEPMDPSALQHLVRMRVDPTTRTRRRSGTGLADRLGLTTPITPGPLALDVHWDHLRVDAAFHRTWWIGTWPRLAQPPAWLEPFLSGGGLTRSMTVHLQPVPAHQSRRRIERDLVKLESDAATKEEKGRRVDARHRRATQALLDREDELVAGYPEIAYAGLVTLAATSLEELDEHSEILEQLGRENGMDLRILHARQDLAWAAALPLGLAPRSLLDVA